MSKWIATIALVILVCALPPATGFNGLSVKLLSTPNLRQACRPQQTVMQEVGMNRRSVLVGIALFTAVTPGPAKAAFPNRIGELNPQLKGKPYGSYTPIPNGVGTGGEPLEGCSNAPNCFSSGGDKRDSHYLAPWTYTKDSDAAWADVLAAVKAYTPGQSGIDGGGWAIVKESPTYVYVQYESLKIGYLDDLEFVHDKANKQVLVRSASRAGYLDFAVNAKRLNFYTKYLRDKGSWDAPDLTPARFRDYFRNNLSES